MCHLPRVHAACSFLHFLNYLVRVSAWKHKLIASDREWGKMVHLPSRDRGLAHDADCYRILYERYPGQLRDCAVPRLKLPEWIPAPSRLFGLVGSRILITTRLTVVRMVSVGLTTTDEPLGPAQSGSGALEPCCPSIGDVAVDPSHVRQKSCGASGIPFERLHRLGLTRQSIENRLKLLSATGRYRRLLLILYLLWFCALSIIITCRAEFSPSCHLSSEWLSRPSFRLMCSVHMYSFLCPTQISLGPTVGSQFFAGDLVSAQEPEL